MTNEPTNTPTQADREAAADLLDELSSIMDHNGIGQVADLIRDGEYDEHEATRAFMRHRLAHTPPAQPEEGESTAYLYTHTSTNHETPYLTVERDALFAELEGAIETPLYAHPIAEAGDGEKLREALRGPVQSEVLENGSWSLRFLFGEGDAARTKMRQVSDAILQLKDAPPQPPCVTQVDDPASETGGNS